MKTGFILAFTLLSLPAMSQIKFPDQALRQVLTQNYNLKFNESFELLNTEVADTITVMNFDFKGISDLTGMEAFPKLQSLSVMFNSLTAVNLQKNPDLKFLDLTFSQLQTLNISENQNLEKLVCSFGKLTALDISQNQALRHLDISSNPIPVMDFSQNPGLKTLICKGNQFKSLDVSKNKNLVTLDCDQNSLVDLDLSLNDSLRFLNCPSNNLKKIALPESKELVSFSAPFNQLVTLDFSGFKKLVQISAGFNNLKTVSFGGNEFLIFCDLQTNLLTQVDPTQLPSLKDLNLSGNMISGLDVSECKNLWHLVVSSNNLKELDLSENTELVDLDAGKNQLTRLNLSENKKLHTLHCEQNSLSELVLNGLTDLGTLDCSVNQLTVLDLSSNTNLFTINLSVNPNMSLCYVWILPFPPVTVTLFTTNTPVVFSLDQLIAGSDFWKFKQRINALPADQKTAVVDSFMTKHPVLPLIEKDSVVTFLFRGAATSVALAGDENTWNSAGIPLTKLAGTNLWFRTQVYEQDARLDYKFILDGSNWIFDPKNPNTAPSGFGSNSELRMPIYPEAPELRFYPEIPHGVIKNETLKSTILGNSRPIKIYLPPGYSEAVQDSFPLVIFHDGLEFVSLALANNTLDFLIAHKKIDPVIGVFVPPVDRFNEYVGAKTTQFASMIKKELIPQVVSGYRISTDRKKTATIGISNGGDISQFLGLKLPEIFHFVGCFSAAGNWHTTSYSQSPKLDLKFYIDAGTYDNPGFLANNDNFVDLVLTPLGYENQFLVFHEGHSWGNWRAHLDNALTYFYPFSGSVDVAGGDKQIPAAFSVSAAYPNPFNPSTTFSVNLPEPGTVSVRVVDLLGKSLQTFSTGTKPAGIVPVQINLMNQASGVYLVRFEFGGKQVLKKIQLVK